MFFTALLLLCVDEVAMQVGWGEAGWVGVGVRWVCVLRAVSFGSSPTVLLLGFFTALLLLCVDEVATQVRRALCSGSRNRCIANRQSLCGVLSPAHATQQQQQLARPPPPPPPTPTHPPPRPPHHPTTPAPQLENPFPLLPLEEILDSTVRDTGR